MTPDQLKTELADLMYRARASMALNDIYDALGQEFYSLQGDMWLHKHYNGDPPPRVISPEPKVPWQVDRPNTCSEMSNCCEQEEGA